MSDEQRPSHSYVLRMWKEAGTGAGWRYSLENVHDGQRRGFGSLAALMAYLEQAGAAPAQLHRS